VRGLSELIDNLSRRLAIWRLARTKLNCSQQHIMRRICYGQCLSFISR